MKKTLKHRIRIILALTMLLGAGFTVGCSGQPELEDGLYGAYFSLPDAQGWNDEVWLLVENGTISERYHLRSSAFGDISDRRVLGPAGDGTGDVDLLLREAMLSAESGREGFRSIDRGGRFSRESFEPDEKGAVYRFTLSFAGNGAGESIYPEYVRMVGDEETIIDLEGEFGVSPAELQHLLAEALSPEDPSDLYERLSLLGESRDAERLRALIVRTMDLTRVREPSRSVQGEPDPHNREAGVVSSHYLATEAGIEILKAGGNAADAAVAVAAALSVVEPWFSSVLGGGTWALYFDSASGTVHSQDGVGPVASRNTADYYAPRAGANGLHQSVVPGAWGGWMEWLQEFGELPLDRILAPAIRLAEEGFPASPELVRWLNIGIDDIRGRRDTAEVYMSNGTLPVEGDTLYMPDLAASFRRLAEVYVRFAGESGHRGGLAAAADYMYRGPLARAITDFSDAENGPFELSDFTGFYGRIVDPISIDYKGLDVYQNPPNSQGITQLMALNILKDYDFGEFSGPDDPDTIHLLTEAIKLAHIDKYYHVGDPDWVDVPVRELLSGKHARERREQIRPDRALEWPVGNLLPVDPDYTHTSTFQIIDGHGNAASVTTSLGAQFYVIGDTGIHINNRMRMLAIKDGSPNLTIPGKKVRHTSNPYMVLDDGRPYILGGNTGVDTQPQGQTQQFIWVVEFGLSPREAVSRPRFLTRAFPDSQYPWQADNDLGMEAGTPQELRDAMAARGHRVTGNGIWGNANMIVIDRESGNLEIGADPRGGVNSGETLSR